MMDPSSVNVTPADLQNAAAILDWVASYGANGIGLTAILGVLVWVWRTSQKHLCEAIPRLLDIFNKLADTASKFADNGFKIRLDTKVVVLDDRDDTEEV